MKKWLLKLSLPPPATMTVKYILESPEEGLKTRNMESLKLPCQELLAIKN